MSKVHDKKILGIDKLKQTIQLNIKIFDIEQQFNENRKSKIEKYYTSLSSRHYEFYKLVCAVRVSVIFAIHKLYSF